MSSISSSDERAVSRTTPWIGNPLVRLVKRVIYETKQIVTTVKQKFEFGEEEKKKKSLQVWRCLWSGGKRVMDEFLGVRRFKGVEGRILGGVWVIESMVMLGFIMGYSGVLWNGFGEVSTYGSLVLMGILSFSVFMYLLCKKLKWAFPVHVFIGNCVILGTFGWYQFCTRYGMSSIPWILFFSVHPLKIAYVRGVGFNFYFFCCLFWLIVVGGIVYEVVFVTEESIIEGIRKMGKWTIFCTNVALFLPWVYYPIVLYHLKAKRRAIIEDIGQLAPILENFQFDENTPVIKKFVKKEKKKCFRVEKIFQKYISLLCSIKSYLPHHITKDHASQGSLHSFDSFDSQTSPIVRFRQRKFEIGLHLKNITVVTVRLDPSCGFLDDLYCSTYSTLVDSINELLTVHTGSIYKFDGNYIFISFNAAILNVTHEEKSALFSYDLMKLWAKNPLSKTERIRLFILTDKMYYGVLGSVTKREFSIFSRKKDLLCKKMLDSACFDRKNDTLPRSKISEVEESSGTQLKHKELKSSSSSSLQDLKNSYIPQNGIMCSHRTNSTIKFRFETRPVECFSFDGTMELVYKLIRPKNVVVHDSCDWGESSGFVPEEDSYYTTSWKMFLQKKFKRSKELLDLYLVDYPHCPDGFRLKCKLENQGIHSLKVDETILF